MGRSASRRNHTQVHEDGREKIDVFSAMDPGMYDAIV
jgi:hypothetical protein